MENTTELFDGPNVKVQTPMELQMYLNIFLLTPVILLGLVGNVLSMLTWSRGCHRTSSTAALLTALGFMDTLVLTLPAIEFWSLNVFGVLLRMVNKYLCKTYGFFSYFAPTSSSWIVVIITAERFVSIWFPIKVRSICTRAKIIVCLFVVFLFIAAIYSPFLVETDFYYDQKQNMTTCDWNSNSSFYKNYFAAWMWMDLCMLFMIPFVVIVVGNSLILYRLLKSRQFHIRNDRHMSCRTRVANAFTVRAIALSIAVLICLLPVTTHEVYAAHSGARRNKMVTTLSHILLYANSAMNFVLYCIIGTGFRKDMKAVLTRMCCPKSYRSRKNATSTNGTQYCHSLLRTDTQL